MQAHLLYHFATEKSINSLKAPNQTLETGQIGYVNTPTHLTGNAQCTGQVDGNGKNGKEISLHLLDDQNGEDQYEALESLSVGTERGVFNTSCACVNAAPVDAVLAEEDQYETLDAVFAQKACHESNDGKGAKMFEDKKANERVLKRDENFEEEVALDENLEDKLFGNDDTDTSSALVYEETKPDSYGIGLSQAESQGGRKNQHENREVNQRQTTNPYINNVVGVEERVNECVYEESVYINDKITHGNGCETQQADAPDCLHSDLATASAITAYANDENAYIIDESPYGNEKDVPGADAKLQTSSATASHDQTKGRVSVHDNDEGVYLSAKDQDVVEHASTESTYDYILTWA